MERHCADPTPFNDKFKGKNRSVLRQLFRNAVRPKGYEEWLSHAKKYNLYHEDPTYQYTYIVQTVLTGYALYESGVGFPFYNV